MALARAVVEVPEAVTAQLLEQAVMQTEALEQLLVVTRVHPEQQVVQEQMEEEFCLSEPMRYQ